MAGNDIREAAARVFGLLSDEERRKRRLTTMMDRLREDGFVEPRAARLAQGPAIGDAARAIEAQLTVGDALRAEAERQLAEQTGWNIDGDVAGWPSEAGTDSPTAESEADFLADVQDDNPIPSQKTAVPMPAPPPVPPAQPWYREWLGTSHLPLESVRYRYEDTWGKGLWHDPRPGRLHRGVDIVSRPGEPVYAPISGTVAISDAYLPNPADSAEMADLRKSFKAIKIIADDGRTIVLRYVLPSDELWDLEAGQRVDAGTPIGTAQELEPLYPKELRDGKPITNHIHIEYRPAPNAPARDPMPLTDEWRRRSLDQEERTARNRGR